MRKITILGMGPTATMRQVDIDSHLIGEVWGLNNGYVKFPDVKWDRFFELHQYSYLKTWDSGTPCHFTDLDNLGVPVYVTEPVPVVKCQLTYDIEEVMWHHGVNYFLGSPSLMLAFALYEHDNGEPIDEIRVWGIDMADEEHKCQKTSWAFWISRATARGINITGCGLSFTGEVDNDAGLSGIKESLHARFLERIENASRAGHRAETDEGVEEGAGSVPPKAIKFDGREPEGDITA